MNRKPTYLANFNNKNEIIIKFQTKMMKSMISPTIQKAVFEFSLFKAL